MATKVLAYQLRCTHCGRRIGPDQLGGDLRCTDCGHLFEVEYPWLSVSTAPAAGESPYGIAGDLGYAIAGAADEGTARVGDDATAGESGRLPGGGNRLGPRSRAADLRARWTTRRSSREAIDQSGVWRFRDLLPIVDDERNIVTLREGNTPLYHLPRSAAALGVPALYAKHQGLNPTGSFKDTGMTAALSVAHEQGYEWVACASTGNTSAAMAAYAARAGMRSLVLIPEGKIAWGKLSQSMDYGALTLQLRTDFDGCVRTLAEVVRRAPVFLLNSVNPYRLEGQKTPAFEIAEEMGWTVPDHILVPGGNLANSSALGKGFLELLELGLIHRLPRISVIQAEGANPFYRMIADGADDLTPVVAETRASAIRIGNPASWRKALRIIQVTGGCCEQVGEAEIALAKAEIGAEGIGCEPASAVTLAGLKKLLAKGTVARDESVVLFLTGHTLKDSDYTIQYHRGQLLGADEESGLGEAMRSTQRDTILLNADAGEVLGALEIFQKRAAAGSDLERRIVEVER